MSAYTSGILHLHIWQVTTWAAQRAGQKTFSNSSIIGAIQLTVFEQHTIT